MRSHGSQDAVDARRSNGGKTRQREWIWPRTGGHAIARCARFAIMNSGCTDHELRISQMLPMLSAPHFLTAGSHKQNFAFRDFAAEIEGRRANARLASGNSADYAAEDHWI